MPGRHDPWRALLSGVVGLCVCVCARAFCERDTALSTSPTPCGLWAVSYLNVLPVAGAGYPAAAAASLAARARHGAAQVKWWPRWLRVASGFAHAHVFAPPPPLLGRGSVLIFVVRRNPARQRMRRANTPPPLPLLRAISSSHVVRRVSPAETCAAAVPGHRQCWQGPV